MRAELTAGRLCSPHSFAKTLLRLSRGSACTRYIGCAGREISPVEHEVSLMKNKLLAMLAASALLLGTATTANADGGHGRHAKRHDPYAGHWAPGRSKFRAGHRHEPRRVVRRHKHHRRHIRQARREARQARRHWRQARRHARRHAHRHAVRAPYYARRGGTTVELWLDGLHLGFYDHDRWY